MVEIPFVTWKQRLLDLKKINPDLIHIDDIAHALGNICRFSGHTVRFYSVAEHSLVLEQVYLKTYQQPTLQGQLACLLHDAAEAYLGDITIPAQALLGVHSYDVPLLIDIFEKFGIRVPEQEEHEPQWEYITRLDSILTVCEGHMMIGGNYWIDKFNWYKRFKWESSVITACTDTLIYGFPCIRGVSCYDMAATYRNRVCYILSCIGAMCDPKFLHE